MKPLDRIKKEKKERKQDVRDGLCICSHHAPAFHIITHSLSVSFFLAPLSLSTLSPYISFSFVCRLSPPLTALLFSLLKANPSPSGFFLSFIF